MFNKTEDDIYYLYEYYPKRSKLHDFESEQVLEFKHGNIRAIDKYCQSMKEAMQYQYSAQVLKDCYVCIMPSHSAGEYSFGLKRLAAYLCEYYGMTNAFDMIIRVKSHEKSSQGGSRSIASHIDSLRFNDKYDVEGKSVIIIDDVTTTGNSIAAVRNILKTHHVAIAYAQAIAKTHFEFSNVPSEETSEEQWNYYLSKVSQEHKPIIDKEEVKDTVLDSKLEDKSDAVYSEIFSIIYNNNLSIQDRIDEIQNKYSDKIYDWHKVRMILNERYASYGKTFNDSFLTRVCRDANIKALSIGNYLLYTENMLEKISSFIDEMIKENTYSLYVSSLKYLSTKEIKEYIRVNVVEALAISNSVEDLQRELKKKGINIERFQPKNISYSVDGIKRHFRGSGIAEEVDVAAVRRKVGNMRRSIVVSSGKIIK